ncbi:MAG: hypothetical protein ACYTGA_10540 [Planctomycetota bacterium]
MSNQIYNQKGATYGADSTMAAGATGQCVGFGAVSDAGGADRGKLEFCDKLEQVQERTIAQEYRLRTVEQKTTSRHEFFKQD